MLPAMWWRISSVVGSGFAATSAAALTTWPGVQKPHCTASARTNASISGCSRRPSIVVTSPCTRCASVMHESVGTPSTCTVQAPQWPSLHAIFVPIRPSSSRSTCASDVPTGEWKSYVWPLMRRSGTARRRQDVGEVEQARARARDQARVRLVLGLGQHPPELARRGQQLADLVELLAVAVPLIGCVEREAARAEDVGLPRG